MKKIIIMTIVLNMVFFDAYGQNGLLQKINDIKKQNDVYYWAQYAHPVEDTAFVNATKWLLDEVNLLFDEQNRMSVKDITPLVKRIKIDAGTKIRAFVYVKKTDIPEGGRMAGETIRGDEEVTSGSTPTPAENPMPAMTHTPAVKTFVPDVFVQNIMERKDIYQVYQFLKEQKSQGTVLQFGALKDIEDYNSLELILFDMQSKEVISVLSPVVSGNNRTNLMTGTTDSLDNYPEDMILAIWYIK